MFVVMLSLPCGWLCTLMGLPPMFGYIICGVLLGPSGLNSIKVSDEHLQILVCTFPHVCNVVFPVLPAVDGSGGDVRRAGRVLHSFCGRSGVFTRTPPQGKNKSGLRKECTEAEGKYVRSLEGVEESASKPVL